MPAVQKRAFPLAGLLANVSPQNLIKPEAESDSLLSIVMVQGLPNLTKSHLGNLSKPDIHRCVMMTNDDILNKEIITSKKLTLGNKFLLLAGGVNWRATVIGRVTSAFASSTHAPEDFLGVVTREGEFLESIKKGSHEATLWNVTSADHSSGVSDFLRRWRRFTSPRAAVTKKPAVLSPASFMLSISSITSWGIRTVVICDFAFFAPVTISNLLMIWCMSLYMTKREVKTLEVYFTLGVGLDGLVKYTKKAKPVGALTPIGLLTTSVIDSNEAAMSNRTTHPQGRDSYTLKKFIWRFLAINRHDKKAKPCRLSVEAETECEARRILAPHFILSLAARLPVVGGSHA